MDQVVLAIAPEFFPRRSIRTRNYGREAELSVAFGTGKAGELRELTVLYQCTDDIGYADKCCRKRDSDQECVKVCHQRSQRRLTEGFYDTASDIKDAA